MVNVAATPPIVSVEVLAVEKSSDERCPTHTVWPLLMVAGACVNVPVHPIEYVPVITLMCAGTSMPVMVTVFEVSSAAGSTPVCAVKVNGSGTLSQMRRVKAALAVSPSTVTSKSCAAQSVMPFTTEIRYSLFKRDEMFT